VVVGVGSWFVCLFVCLFVGLLVGWLIVQATRSEASRSREVVLSRNTPFWFGLVVESSNSPGPGSDSTGSSDVDARANAGVEGGGATLIRSSHQERPWNQLVIITVKSPITWQHEASKSHARKVWAIPVPVPETY